MSGSGIELHDELKERFGFDRGIVRSYRLTYGSVAPRAPLPDDVVEERLVELGEETTTAVGTGRSWVIDVERRAGDGALVSVERWSMFGYPSGSMRADRGSSSASAADDSAAPEMFGELAITAEFVRASAAANGVEVPVHHDTAAARAAGARDIFLDTATQVALFAARASEQLDGDRRVRSVELRMRAPICAGDTLGFLIDGCDAVDAPADAPGGADGTRPELRLRALVGGATVSSAVVAFAP